MDSITKAIWGENSTHSSGEEPVSGEQGPGTPSHPYDKGNEAIQEEEDAKNAESANAASSATDFQRDGPSDSTNQTGDPSSGAQPTQKQQGADRPAATPDDSKDSSSGGSGGKKFNMPHTDEEREELMKTGEFPHDPDDHSGEPMRMHGGQSGKPDSSSTSGGNDGGKTDRSASVAQEGGGPHGKTLGTGEKYVKTSGVAADGGDFDATKPGAGQEATRLMEQMGIKTEGQQAPGQQEDEKPAKEPEVEKHGKLTKLKEKLHIGKAH